MKDQSTSFAILERALAAAQADEADAAFIAIDHNISRFANSQLHQNMSEESASLTLRVVVNGAFGVATTTVFEDDEIERTAALAREAAKHSNPVQGFHGLYRDNEPLPRVDGFDEPTAALAPMEKALALRAMFERGKDVQFAGAYASGATSVACGNTHGVRRYARSTFADATVIAIGKNGSGYATARQLSASRVDVGALGEEATLKATLASERIEDLEPGPYDVILEPPALAEVFDWLNMIALTGQSYEDGSSFFVGNLDKKILGENFTLLDDATDPGFLPFPFDIEGLPKRRTPLVENGVLRTPVLDKEWADRLGLKPTANAWSLGSPEHGSAFHLSMAGGDSTREEMIASTKLGIWVTRFNYVNGLLEPRTALMTGTTRDGTFLIRDGKVAARLPNLRWTQSMVEAFSSIEALSKERRSVGTWYNMFGGTLAPVAKIRGWNITGKQETRSES
ncbi:MAG TPA: TldD/PmbA family protein [Thermoanaerobaculia bacterium]|nr:TldD/PmbA family protein [Thermoanaerobaculia bacterium]